ncbi:unnamed protein product [Lactuca virosa]|uniref:Uncharacterized protein n=1 Tax=Lactuca virosa TaxID=75947 RepID=A0AAU9MVB3_9ASTR|nr:unnamed protein product [Lactuca virosa]
MMAPKSSGGLGLGSLRAFSIALISQFLRVERCTKHNSIKNQRWLEGVWELSPHYGRGVEKLEKREITWNVLLHARYGREYFVGVKWIMLSHRPETFDSHNSIVPNPRF